MSSWNERLKAVIGPRGYDNGMRRSLQSIVLFEAKRCLTERLSALRPFQRKLAFVDQAHALVETLDFLLPHQKEEILWRTATSKEALQPDIAWKRVKLIEKEMSNLAEKVKPFIDQDRTHEDCCDLLVQSLYEAANGKGKPHPLNWEHAHNNVVMAFRLYYHYDALDETFPEPAPPKEIIVPADKPPTGNNSNNGGGNNTATRSYTPRQRKNNNSNGGTPGATNSSSAADLSHLDADGALDVAAVLGGEQPPKKDDPIAARRKLLSEVKEHLDLLKQFEGIISEEDLAQRKRELFAALPPAPPPSNNNSNSTPPNNNNKKQKTTSNNATSTMASPVKPE